MKVKHYRIRVWNNEGEIVRSEWDCDEHTMEDIEDEYGERSNFDVVCEQQWETEEDFEWPTSPGDA